MTYRIPLGSKAKDIVTGFTGIVTGVARYLTGCDQYILMPQDGKPSDGCWFDDNRLELLEVDVVRIPVGILPEGKKGGPVRNAAPIK